METRPCKRCEGTGIITYSYNSHSETCFACKGKGTFAKPDYLQIVKDVCTSRGRKEFRNSPPFSLRERKDERTRRAYFVWRMARFHGGADVTMPMEAEFCVTGDPYHDELDAFAGKVAEKVFGTQLAAVSRWSGLLYNQVNIPGLPASAYHDGPVADKYKPLEELAELMC